MVKLAKYLKPYVLLLFLAVFFIFVQAMSDLSLPDYMSKMVNVGIQQGGIINAVPEAIRKSEMDKLLLFVTPEEKGEILNDYTLVDKSSVDYNKYIKKYPILSKEPVYVLKNIDSSEIDKINLSLGKAWLAAAGIEQAKANAKNGSIEFDGKKIPANVDLFSMMSQLPEDQLLKVRDEMNKKFASLGDNMVIQAATMAVKDEYKAIGIDTNKIQTDYILHTGLIMLLITGLSALSTIMVAFFASKVAAAVARDLRRDLFARVESFSNAEFDKFSTASLITRTTNDITQIQMLLVIMIRMVFYAPIMGIGGVFRALSKSVSMSWIIALAVIVLLGIISVLYSIAMPKFLLMQKLIDRLNLVTRENLSGIMVVRAFNNQKFEEERFDKANQDITKVGLFVNRAMAVMFPSMMLVMNGVTLLIVWVGAHQIQNSGMQVGDMMAFMQYAIQIIFAFLMFSMLFIMIPRASVSAERIAEVLATEPSIKDPQSPKQFNENMAGSIEFKNVSFKYPGAEEYALKDINFKVLPGQTVGIIGRTGSGKSTLVNLILRFYDATEGQVLVDGVDVKEVRQEDLRSRIGYVPQKSWLFSGTIKSNLKYGNDQATDEEIKEAAEIAQAMEFINEKSKKFDSEIAQGGTNVSGGQKQRLSIARALVKKPEIYIFDESFSALDFKTESALRKALRERLKSSTVIIVSQRVSTLLHADQIIVLEEGKIVGIGKHKELLKNCQTYREIALSQLSEGELA
ncbi:ABC transporter related protein [Thermoanaerobacter mathranii subsp. mathranii str. A3]|uniref:ABC transporter related protein n=1 Tax=Thermoanaerobacter mathranii subsp. mathranii (strain DSM 11426 / CCUG 53645 / CIP 108742 / A3) TaxID=583358 RepID=A0ABM5LSI4_THEM3|nr:ABC transporter ATP-binding protein [Thermoanaerobacter mathranii]ADH61779.1 ABC transporter related protein [Thermoanaerobacter mathranii subsp. mathranii str. A3]